MCAASQVIMTNHAIAVQSVQYADLPYFVGLATLTIYIGAHRGLTQRIRQQISLREVQLSCLSRH